MSADLSERDPFTEDPRPPLEEVDEHDFEGAWIRADAEDDALVCPACTREPKGHFIDRGTAPSNGERWIEFRPCAHVIYVAEWARSAD